MANKTPTTTTVNEVAQAEQALRAAEDAMRAIVARRNTARAEQEQATADLEKCTNEEQAIRLVAKATVAKNVAVQMTPEIDTAAAAVRSANNAFVNAKTAVVRGKMEAVFGEMEAAFDSLWRNAEQYISANDERRSLYIQGGGDPLLFPEDFRGTYVMQKVRDIASVFGYEPQVEDRTGALSYHKRH